MGRPCPVTKEQELEIVAKYQAGKSRNALALEYNASRWFIADCLDRHGVVRRRHLEAFHLSLTTTVRPDAFAMPLGDEAAYAVGFLMADGCISQRGRQQSHLIIQINECDKPILEWLRDFLGSNHAIQHVPAQPKDIYGKTYIIGPFSRLDIGSQRLCDNLAAVGVVPNKTHRTLAHHSMLANRHFWRGMVDGDGWVGTAIKHGQQIPRINLTGTKPLLEQYATFVRSITAFAANVSPDKTAWQCPATGRHAIRIMNHLYADATVALPRKAAAAQRLVAEHEDLLDPNLGYHWRRKPTGEEG